ncbi:response regulator [Microcoleus sp. FACHB-SPT15]|jgi:chemotaxis family two-component system response regulator Rcp1|nr:response regulator [Microcoleus sp. FACHB-SPT15]MBD1807190.1 response regulator [Microcoleus sp. FACHB-SPT15]NEQ21522.1 response regulator [Microcoleus sp. SIO2G3]
MPADAKNKTILLIEDNRGDIRLIQEALKSTAAQCEVVTARDGMEAMAYLRQDGDYADAVRPDLILLDLNLPKKDGREVLAEIKADSSLKHIPIIVLTTSRNEEDIFKSYDLHVNCYISKSRNLSQLFKIVRGIEEFWLETATLPPEST